MHDFLITATLSALYASNCNLKSIFPILLGAFDPNQLFQQSKSSLPQYFHNYYPVLAECMTTRTEVSENGSIIMFYGLEVLKRGSVTSLSIIFLRGGCGIDLEFSIVLPRTFSRTNVGKLGIISRPHG